MESVRESGEDSELLLRFPALEPQAGEKPANPLPPRDAQAHLQILLVDDDELIRCAMAPMLELLGHRVQTVDSGFGALRLFEGGLEVDLVVLDVNMPRMDGVETLRRLLLLKPDQKVLMASGYNDWDMQSVLAGHPGITSLQKPFSLDEFQAKVAALNILPKP